jgi:hypothetical protein
MNTVSDNRMFSLHQTALIANNRLGPIFLVCNSSSVQEQHQLTFTIPGWDGARYALVRRKISLSSSPWADIVVAGGGAYYFAKKQINADRAQRLEESRKKRQMIDSLEYSDNVPSKPGSSSTMGSAPATANGVSPRTDPSGSPSQEAGNDPAPTRHAPATEGQRVFEKSKYESSTPFKSQKGDRFS